MLEPQPILVWRTALTSRFRALSYDEAMIFDEMVNGKNFAAICEMLGTYWPEQEAPMKAAGYLHGWLQTELIAAIHINTNS